MEDTSTTLGSIKKNRVLSIYDTTYETEVNDFFDIDRSESFKNLSWRFAWRRSPYSDVEELL